MLCRSIMIKLWLVSVLVSGCVTDPVKPMMGFFVPAGSSRAMDHMRAMHHQQPDMKEMETMNILNLPPMGHHSPMAMPKQEAITHMPDHDMMHMKLENMDLFQLNPAHHNLMSQEEFQMEDSSMPMVISASTGKASRVSNWKNIANPAQNSVHAFKRNTNDDKSVQVFEFEIESGATGKKQVQTIEVEGSSPFEFGYILDLINKGFFEK